MHRRPDADPLDLARRPENITSDSGSQQRDFVLEMVAFPQQSLMQLVAHIFTNHPATPYCIPTSRGE
jgi:hypothetical protein